MKKIISIAIAIISFAFLTNIALGLSPVKKIFSDVTGETKYATAIEFLKYGKIIEGYSDGEYKPEKLLNRAEFLKILEDLIAEEGIDPKFAKKECFTDVKADEWYTEYICYAKETGVVSGYEDGTFKPEQTINLVEALKITLKAFKYEYKQTNTWYKGFVDVASYMNIIPPDFTSFSQKVNRGQMAELATRIKKYDLDQLDEFLGDEYDGLNAPIVTYETLEEGIDVEDEDEKTDTETSAYCTEEPEQTDIGSLEYPIDPKYKNVGSYLSQLLTASDCEDKNRIENIFGIVPGGESTVTIFTLGSNLTLDGAPSTDFLGVLHDIGYACTESGVSDSQCVKWELTSDSVSVEKLYDLKPYVDEIKYGDCVNCG